MHHGAPLHIHKVVKLVVIRNHRKLLVHSQGPGHSLQARPAMGLPYTPVIPCLLGAPGGRDLDHVTHPSPRAVTEVICGCCVHCRPTLTPYTPPHLLLGTTASALLLSCSNPSPVLRVYQVLAQAGVWPGSICSSSTAWTSVYTIN